MRLIDAWKLCEYANNLKDKQVDANDIMRFPTVDAEPIRHGKWIDDRVAFYKQCSECGAYVRANLYEVFLDCDIRDLHYCPNCGAKMDLPEIVYPQVEGITPTVVKTDEVTK